MSKIIKIKSSYMELSNAIRFLSIDMIEHAKSGHIGMPLGMSDIITILFKYHLNINPYNPYWPKRDRFILSNGHGSAILYATSYLIGYKNITLKEIKNFRKLNSKTPGHPEKNLNIGIETTTGPLGQGFANAVGAAIGERIIASQFGEEIAGNFTYCFVGDGCLMEGLTYEAAALAGHFKLGRLIVILDDNNITIDGPKSLSCSENITKRFKSNNWQVLSCNGHNIKQINKTLKTAKKDLNRPTLIRCITQIGYGNVNLEGTESLHGYNPNKSAINLLRKNLNWKHLPFNIPKQIIIDWKSLGKKNLLQYNLWNKYFKSLPKNIKKDFLRRQNTELNKENIEILKKESNNIKKLKKDLATRETCGDILNNLSNTNLEFIGGSSDLGKSNNILKINNIIYEKNFNGSYIHYGIREHAMIAIMNGLSIYGGLRAYGGTFLVFSDYCKPAIRLSALMKLTTIYIFSHDSIGVGEDGPTHQPIEQLSNLRKIPNISVMRPGDILETIQCVFITLLMKKQPTILCLSRQKILYTKKTRSLKNYCLKGGYIINPDLITRKKNLISIITNGSETNLAIKIKNILEKNYIITNVISTPCLELFYKQNDKYKLKILGNNSVLKISIEASNYFGWYKYTQLNIGINKFGISTNAKNIFFYFGFNIKNISCKIINLLNN